MKIEPHLKILIVIHEICYDLPYGTVGEFNGEPSHSIFFDNFIESLEGLDLNLPKRERRNSKQG